MRWNEAVSVRLRLLCRPYGGCTATGSAHLLLRPRWEYSAASPAALELHLLVEDWRQVGAMLSAARRGSLLVCTPSLLLQAGQTRHKCQDEQIGMQSAQKSADWESLPVLCITAYVVFHLAQRADCTQGANESSTSLKWHTCDSSCAWDRFG